MTQTQNASYKVTLKRFTVNLSSNCAKHNETLRFYLNCVREAGGMGKYAGALEGDGRGDDGESGASDAVGCRV